MLEKLMFGNVLCSLVKPQWVDSTTGTRLFRFVARGGPICPVRPLGKYAVRRSICGHLMAAQKKPQLGIPYGTPDGTPNGTPRGTPQGNSRGNGKSIFREQL